MSDINKLIESFSKRIDDISGRVGDISKRVDNVEDLDYKFWIPTGISIVAVLIASGQTYLTSRSTTLSTIQSSIDSAKSQYESIAIQIATSANPNDPILLQAEKSCLERVFNKYDDGCSKFFKCQISRKDFKELYHQSIVDFVEKYPEKFDNLTRFNNMLRYYRKCHQQH